MKQKAMAARTKEFERIQQEEILNKKGCPIKKAEKLFYEHIARKTEERTEKYLALRSAATLLKE